MHTPPRVAFSLFRDADDPMLLAWGRFRSLLESPRADVADSDRNVMPPTAPAPAERTVWRLFASNNREVARGALVYTSFRAARDHVVALKARTAELEMHVVRGPVSGAYGWILALDERTSATCARWYPSSACAESATSALALLRNAVVADDWRWTPRVTRRGAPERATWG
ncbi:hypothetical protein [Agromyces sp. Soil535]|uniref:hypothetical protein n=1 Tax=Agromyces sp. Soil535 TaxID=1736390 RepID=UPI0006F5B44D|nr:hypothetical protein [Agromyces sp. Soil535]KRE23025.1 hypothetical protein ASG80_09190 [Agromyces sp. Soil535]